MLSEVSFQQGQGGAVRRFPDMKSIERWCFALSHAA